MFVTPVAALKLGRLWDLAAQASVVGGHCRQHQQGHWQVQTVPDAAVLVALADLCQLGGNG
jgi:hypothetical protein